MSKFYKFGLRSNLRYTCDGASLGSLEDQSVVSKRTEAKHVRPFDYRR